MINEAREESTPPPDLVMPPEAPPASPSGERGVRQVYAKEKGQICTFSLAYASGGPFIIFPQSVVVFAFILCWLPFHVARYLFSKSFEAGSLEIALISQYCNLVSFVLFYLSAAINPILYNIMSKKYRAAACRLFRLKKVCRKAPYTTNDESSPAWTESYVSS